MNCDSFFSKSVLCRPLTVFRGESCDDRYLGNLKAQGLSTENPSGFLAVNTAYNSTSLNMSSAMYFSTQGTLKDGDKSVPCKDGMIYVVDLPVGVNANYVHNVAGYTQQYEVTLDRKYDLQITEQLLTFKDNNGFNYHVVRANLVTHPSNGAIDKNQSAPLVALGKTNYDVNGKVSVESEYSEGVLHEAFQKIRKRGFSDVQWQAKDTLTFKGEEDNPFDIDNMIVLRSRNVDAGMAEDIGFSLVDNRLLVRKIRTKVENRGDHSGAKDLRWSEYGLTGAFADLDWNGNENQWKQGLDGFDLAMYQRQDGRQVLYLNEGTPDEIATKIINYAKTHENLCLLPILDVARYFDTTFQQIIVQEGYELKESIRVERRGENLDPQSGYVPCKYTINGDNDDHLVLMMKFERGQNKKLNLEYRGKSQGTAVKDSKALSYSVFNDDTMYQLSMNILYTFEKKMHLSKARKIDNLVNYFCYQTGCTAVRCPKSEGEDITKSYKVWDRGRKSYFMIDAIKLDSNMFSLSVTKDDVFIGATNIDTSGTIYDMYRTFVEFLMNENDNAEPFTE